MAAGDRLGAGGMIAYSGHHLHRGYVYAIPARVARTVLESGINANLSLRRGVPGAPEDFSLDTCGDCRNLIALTEGSRNGAGDGQIKVDASIHEYTSNPPLWWMAGHAAGHGSGDGTVHVSETWSQHESLPPKVRQDPGGPAGPVRWRAKMAAQLPTASA